MVRSRSLRMVGTKRRRRLPTKKQIRHLRDLSYRLGVEMPRVLTASQARDAIRRLERNLADKRQPVLEGFGR